jgi:hypothetical protein
MRQPAREAHFLAPNAVGAARVRASDEKPDITGTDRWSSTWRIRLSVGG